MSKKAQPWLVYALVGVALVSLIFVLQFGSGNAARIFQGFMGMFGETSDNQTQQAITSIELGLGDSEAVMRSSIGIWVQASGAGPFEGEVVKIYGKHLGTGLETHAANVPLDANGFFLDRHQFMYPGDYKFWAKYDTIRSSDVALKIKGVLIEVPPTFRRGTQFSIKVYSDRSGEYVVWYALNGDWANEARFINEVDVNEGGYGKREFLWWPAQTGDYWFDARQGTYTSESCGVSVFTEVS